MNGVGYTISDVNNLIRVMEEGLIHLKSSMEEEWLTLTNNFRLNWIGEDEAAFEKNIAEELKNMYTNCDSIIVNAMEFIYSAAQAWIDFQIQSANSFGEGVTTIGGLDDFSHIESQLEITVEEQSFSVTQIRGLQSEHAGQGLIAAIDNYIESVTSCLYSLGDTISTGNAFVGNDQRNAMEGFISNIIQSSINVTKMIDSLKNETIPRLENAYREQQNSTQSDTLMKQNNIQNDVIR